MLKEATKEFISTLCDTSSTGEQINKTARHFIDVASKAKNDDVHSALGELSSVFSFEDMERGAFAAIVAGALLEQGCNPAPVLEPLITLLQRHLELSAKLAQECEKLIQPQIEADTNDGNEDEERDIAELFYKSMPEVACRMPLEAEGWEALDASWRAGITLFSLSKEGRLKGRHLRQLAEKSAEYHQGSYWLSVMLSVMDDEPFLAIEPDTMKGIIGKMTGVVENFQLHTLLMDAFPQGGIFSTRRVSKQVADIAKGNGPQSSEDTVIGAWNMYDWTAVSLDLKLPDATNTKAHANWIWGEGKPEDIPVFDGFRVVLLGPPSYERSFPSQRMFDLLKANLTIEKHLSKSEAIEWLKKMASAPKPTID